MAAPSRWGTPTPAAHGAVCRGRSGVSEVRSTSVRPAHTSAPRPTGGSARAGERLRTVTACPALGSAPASAVPIAPKPRTVAGVAVSFQGGDGSAR
ncbi:hypothetical protein EHYA_08087 [Embleya hyalina]|uniref:Uncharacterized protein n=1 Tax=Embleya hyalina TaxID=516124 RepID=A0A401Z0K3_9ACTN|nr:hypothetical protein EHYA_08087 [Embleya hyalina]